MTAAPAPDMEPHDPSEPAGVPRPWSRRRQLGLGVGAAAVVLGLGAWWRTRPEPTYDTWADGTKSVKWKPDVQDRLRAAMEGLRAVPSEAPASTTKVGCPPLPEPAGAAVSAEDRATYQAISRWVQYDAPQVESWLQREQLPGMAHRTPASVAVELHLRLCLSDGRPSDQEGVRTLVQEWLVDAFPHSAWEASVREDVELFPRPFQVDTRLVTAPPPLALKPFTPAPAEDPDP